MEEKGETMTELFAEDRWTKEKIFEVLFVLGMAAFVLIFYATNIPALMTSAQLYWWLLMGGMIFIIFSFITPKVGDWIFDMPLWSESPVIPKQYDKWLLIGFIAIGLLTFFIIGRTGYAIAGGVDFQIIEPGIWGEAILKFFCALPEDVIFFSVVPALIFLLAYGLTKNIPFSFFLILLITPVVFLLYHTLHYGFENIVASTAVYLFGLELSGAILLFRKLLYAHLRHGANNASIALFKQMSLSSFFIILLTSLWVWLIFIIVILVIILKVLKKI